jgi:hypothetical protein
LWPAALLVLGCVVRNIGHGEGGTGTGTSTASVGDGAGEDAGTSGQDAGTTSARCSSDCTFSGTVLWTRTHDGGGLDHGRGIATDGEDNILVVGSTWNGTDYDVWVRKYDASGTEIWTREFDSGTHDRGRAIATDGEDNILVAGCVLSGTDHDIWLRKYDASGAETWTQTYDGGWGNDESRGIATDTAGDVLVAGHTRSETDDDAWVSKYDASGTELWTRTVDGGSIDDWGHGIATDGADNVLVAGRTGYAPGFEWVRMYDVSGTEVWARTYDISVASNVASDGASNLLVVGDISIDSSDIWTGKYDASGSELWTRTFDGGRGDGGSAVATDGADNVVVTGHCYGSGSSVDILVRKYDASGTELWTSRTADGLGYAVATDGAQNVLVVASWERDPSTGTGWDIWVRKYAP